MSDLIVEVTQLRSQVDRLRDEQARAEARVFAAEEEQTRLLEKLCADFAISTIEEAQALLVKLDVEIGTEMESIRLQLAQTGG